MIPELRKTFNAQWRPELYSDFVRYTTEAAGIPVGFRLNETPIFLPARLLEKMVRYGIELYDQIGSNGEYREASEAAIPDQFRVPNEDPHPLFMQADFGLVEEADGSFEPKLVEIQGFPSIYAFQAILASAYEAAYGLNKTIGSGLTPYLDGLNQEQFRQLLGRVILGGHAPEEVVLLEIDPYRQKTAADFFLTRKWLGIKIACVTEIRKEGRKLFLDGTPIRRIYNRVIVDELMRKNIKPAFSFTDDLDVEWAGHPNWFFRLSKFSLPWFRHVSVPETKFLSDVDTLPDDLDNYVLKPLYYIAGLGVKIGPSREEIEAIPDTERGNFILQRKMHFVSTIDTPAGMTKAEIRIMYIREGNQWKPATTVIRTGRGKMMGVDFNRNLEWVGASAAFWIPE